MSSIFKKIDHFLHPPKGEIWMLHRVTANKSGVEAMMPFEISPAQLDKLLNQYQQRGYSFVSIDEVYYMHISKRYPSNPFLCVTLDDGYLDNMVEALPIFQKYNCPFCIYVTSGFTDGIADCWWYPEHDVPFMSADQLRQISQESLCTIGAHTITHPYLSKLSSDEKRHEIVASRQRMEEILGMPVYHFSYPLGDFDKECIEIVRKAGFRTATMAWGGGVRSNSNMFTLPRIRM